MAERVVKVTLRAQIAEYKKGMLEAAASTRTVGTEAEKLAQKKAAFQQVGAAGLAMGVSIGAGLTMAVAKFANFDQAMSNVAATGQDARDNIDALRKAAIDAGAATVFSADESANAIEEMAKAGVDAKDVLGGGLTGALDLAAAGGIGVADAAGIAATALKVFNLEGSDMSHVADLLAAGAGKAMGDVTDLSQALAQGGQVAAATGLSIEETTATLAAFASQGLLGSDAGTSFKTMLQRLTPQSAEAKRKMDELGISAYDAAGEFVGMKQFAGNLQQALKDLTPEQRNAALSIMFGSDAVRAANVVYQEGADGIADWIAKVDDSGYAAETAATRLDNLKGDWEALMGALDSAMIGSGEAANGPLRFFVQELTSMVDVFNQMPAGGQQAVFWVGAVASAGALAGGAYFAAVPKIAAYNAAIATLGTTAQRTSRILGTMSRVAVVGGAAATAAWGVDALANAIAKNLLPSAEKIDNQMRNAKSGVDLFAAALAAEGINNADTAAGMMGRLAGELDKVADSDFWHPASTSGTAVTVAKQLADIANSGDMALFSAQFRKLGDDANLTERQMRTFIRANPELEDALTKHATAAGMSADAQSLLEVALGGASDATQDQVSSLEELQGIASTTTDDVNALADSIRNFGSAQFDTERASIAFGDAFADLQEKLEAGEGSLDKNTDAGRRTADALLDVAASTNDYAAAVAAMGGSTEDVQGILESGRQKIIDTRLALGDSEDAAKRYADQLIATPETIATQVELSGIDEAYDALAGFKSLLGAVPSTKSVTVKVGEVGWGVLKNSTAGGLPDNAAGAIWRNGVKEFAAGAFLPGIYPATPGGIHRFAEAGYAESYITMDPKYRDRSVGIWQETGRRLGVEHGEAGSRTEINVTQEITTPSDVGADSVADAVVRKLEFEMRGAR